ncbi:MAG: hypothetical protein ABSF37_08500 [Sedimentisphaerales bacterium]|jgi:hypothetical protein
MTRKTSDTVNLTIQEYAAVFPTAKIKYTEEKLIDWARVEAKLQNKMEWTEEGARHLTMLAREYGEFMLRNALSLANVLGVEDGSLGL